MWLNHRNLRLGPKLGFGGEAEVFRLTSHPGKVFKKYTKTPSREIRAKLEWMVAHPPVAAALERLTWPEMLVRDDQGALIGYVMRQLPAETVALGTVMAQDMATITTKLKRVPFTLRDRHGVALNLVRLLAATHAHNYVVVDLNHNNIQVTAKGHVVLIDNDSFQATATDGTVYPCNGAAVAEYWSPELPSTLANVRTTHDAFVLAVLIFKLLMNSAHPFRGSYRGPIGDDGPPDETKLLEWRAYPHDVRQPNPQVRPHRKTPALALLHKDIVALFQRCFTEGLDRPDRRPTPQEWIRALTTAMQAMSQCKRGHWYSTDRPQCLTKGQYAFCGATTTSTATPLAFAAINPLTGDIIGGQRHRKMKPQPVLQRGGTTTQGGSPQLPIRIPGGIPQQPITIPGGPWWHTGNATVDAATKQTEAMLRGLSHALEHAWHSATHRARGRPVKLVAAAAILMLLLQTGVAGNIAGSVSAVLGGAAEQGSIEAAGPEPTKTDERANRRDTAASTQGPEPTPAGAALVVTTDVPQREAASEPAQPTIAPTDLTGPTSSVVVIVANTGGSGLFVNREPNLSYPIRLYPEGTELEVLNPEIVIADGYQWQQVKAPDGTVGWVAIAFTVPRD